ncbi:MAG: phosphoglycerate dehydrogenase [Bacillota bacterium]|nr:phosphoglycerate dehydrogenase [Bacillota bacterium]
MAFRVLTSVPTTFKPYNATMKEMLEAAGFEVVQRWEDAGIPKDELIKLIPEFDGMIMGLDRLDADVIAAGKRLKVLAKYGVGYDNIDVEAATKAGVVVANTPGGNSTAVAELAIGLMIAVARDLVRSNSLVKSGSILPQVGPELEGKTVGIIGLGNIGKRVATRLAAFGCKILVNDIVTYPEWPHAFPITYVSKEEIYRKADIITVHTPLTPETRGMIGEKELRMMKPTAILINTARGGIVDEGALAVALKEKWIAGAGFDAYTLEPPVDPQTGKVFPMLENDNMTATTHIGGSTYEAIKRIGEMAATNVIRVLSGKKPINAVNPEVAAKLADVAEE